MSDISQPVKAKLPDLPTRAKVEARQSTEKTLNGKKASSEKTAPDKEKDFNSVINRLINKENAPIKDKQNPALDNEAEKAEKKSDEDLAVLEALLAQNPALFQIATLVDVASIAQAENATTGIEILSANATQPNLPQIASLLPEANAASAPVQNVQVPAQNAFDELVQMLSANQNVQNVNQQQSTAVAATQVLGQEKAPEIKADNQGKQPIITAKVMASGEVVVEKAVPEIALNQSNVQRAALQAKVQNVPVQQIENTVTQSKEKAVNPENFATKAASIQTQVDKATPEETSSKIAQQASVLNAPLPVVDTLQNVKAPVITNEADVQFINKSDLLNQVSAGAIKNAEIIGKDFVMTLKPEGLGEITVKMSEQQGHMTLQLTASNQSVQKILSAELEQLREAMKPYRVEVSEVNTKTGQQFTFSQDNSAAQQQHNRQLAQQFEFARQRQSSPSYYGYGYNTNESENEEPLAVPVSQNIRLQAMDRYI